MKPTIHLHKGDLPDHLVFKESIAVDTEAMGLNHHRDRLCLVQLSAGDGICHLVHFPKGMSILAPNLRRVLTNPSVLKIFHFARFDMALLSKTFDIDVWPVYCTKIASKLVRTFTDRHSLKELCRDLLSTDLSKEQQVSDWGAPILTLEQQEYAARDVLHLHALKNKLDALLEREERMPIAQRCFSFLPTCIHLDLLGYTDLSVFQH